MLEIENRVGQKEKIETVWSREKQMGMGEGKVESTVVVLMWEAPESKL